MIKRIESIKPFEFGVRATFISEVLGTKPLSTDIFDKWLNTKNPDEKLRLQELEEAKRLQEEFEKKEESMTIFHRDFKGNLIIYDYQILGFFKEACGAMREADEGKSSGLKAYKKAIDNLIKVYPRYINMQMPEGSKPGTCSRPLRAMTMQGPRVTIVKSETVPAGTIMEFTVSILKKSLLSCIVEWLDYGKRKGMCQWRNGGKGLFTWVETEVQQC